MERLGAQPHAATLLTAWQLMHEIEPFPTTNRSTLKSRSSYLQSPPCDFTASRQRIERARPSTCAWIDGDG
ncbi:hypothetical protein [Tabrizicola sp.]|uniref:hypothetical protein n=1 Tax=Tabrizicola sp. TaxID=2005166 RepID=UPI0025D21B9E|nr:hypothetical protein [Tabrizicola sp.]